MRCGSATLPAKPVILSLCGTKYEACRGARRAATTKLVKPADVAASLPPSEAVIPHCRSRSVITLFSLAIYLCHGMMNSSAGTLGSFNPMRPRSPDKNKTQQPISTQLGKTQPPKMPHLPAIFSEALLWLDLIKINCLFSSSETVNPVDKHNSPRYC